MRFSETYSGSDLAELSGVSASYRATRSTETSYEAACRLTTMLGKRTPIVDRYLAELSRIPAQHLALLERRGTRLMFAPTIDAALTNSWADKRRGRQLSFEEERETRLSCGPESGTAAVYDHGTNALIFPTGYCAKDLRTVVLHELGHALTLERAVIRAALLEGLPRRIARHVASYEESTPEATLRTQVAEALAEAYGYAVEGRGDELPRTLSSELTFILLTVEEKQTVRLDLEMTPDGERTASRGSMRELLDARDPEHGHLFVDLRLDPDAEAWDLVDDEMAARRRKRHAA